MTRPQWIGFPNPVNEVAARVVAAGVLLSAITLLVLSATAGHGWLWGIVVLAYGFIARVLSGPRFSPLGLVATKVIAPRIAQPKLVPGPPKRFAQAIGAAVTLGAVAAVALDHPTAAQALLGVMVVAAGLESGFGFCIGCRLFAGLMRVGLVSPATCDACANVALRA
jgi:hypothetical protein